MRILRTTAAIAALSVLLAACDDGSAVDEDVSEAADAVDDTASEATDERGDTASEAISEAMAHMGDMEMGSSDGPRADDVEGATLRTAAFVVLDGAPEAMTGASGTAYLALDEGTTLTVDVEGLPAGTAVVGHLHAESCATSGGAHFQLDADGGDTPPNEVHLAATADADGMLSVTVTNEMAATDAMSVVIHAADADGDKTKALCADLAG